jgi:hypothetical protein
VPKKSKKPTVKRRENAIQRAAEEVEARFLEGAEMATETTSAETNVALAAWTAIRGPEDDEGKPAAKPQNANPKATRSKKR